MNYDEVKNTLRSFRCLCHTPAEDAAIELAICSIDMLGCGCGLCIVHSGKCPKVDNPAFSYKGFKGSKQYNKEDNVWHGKILDTKDLVTYESDWDDYLEKEFQAAVDDYLQMKEELVKDFITKERK